MKKSMMISLIVGVFLLILGCASTKSFVKNQSRLKQIQKIAVIPFVCNNAPIGHAVADSLSMNLIQTRYTIIERSHLQRLLEEQKISVDNSLEVQDSIIGRLKGIDAIIVGSVTMDRGFAGLAYGGNKDYVSTATARLVDIATGEVLMAATFSSSGASTMSGVHTPADVGEKLAKQLGIR